MDESRIDDFQDMFENAPCGYITIQTNGRIARVNKTLLGWIGRVQGLAIDRAGNFYIAGAESHTSGSAIAVIRPDGKEVCAMILDVPRNIASLALSGDERTLYVSGAGEYRLHHVRFDPPAK